VRSLRLFIAGLIAPELRTSLLVRVDTTQATAALAVLRNDIECVAALARDRHVACDINLTITSEVRR
jgi:hypothetical protein